MKVKAADLKPGDVLCVEGQIGEFVELFGKRKQVCYRPFGCDTTRLRTPTPAPLNGFVSAIRVERGQQWVEVVK